MDLLTQTIDGVCELRLNRPQRLNALTLTLSQELLRAARAAVDDSAVRVLLIAGEGRSFCAGKDRDDPPSTEWVETLQALTLCLMASPKPVVSAVQGWAVGAGLELMLNTDIALVAQSARFALPEVQVGLFGTGGVAALLPRLVGLQKAKGLLMLGEPLDAVTAERLGLVWAVVNDDGLQQRAWAVARQLAASDARLLGELKHLLHGEHLGDLRAVLARETAVHARLHSAGP
jgi:2-(1,2-epoxy-1,2-dihydrophenyl)acetyl-CoA isomerase